jgi:TusA-related sulfurtransferase
MAENFELNCIGMKCPRPIIEIAKAARRSQPGSILSVRADDLAFESDVKAWVENTKAILLKMEKDGNLVVVEIRLA